MPNLDWKTIVNKIIQWGFSATFALLGIALMAAHKQIDLPIYAGLTVSLVGVLIYALTTVMENKVKQVSEDNKVLKAKVIELEGKIDELTKLLNDKDQQLSNLLAAHNENKAKIKKLEGAK